MMNRSDVELRWLRISCLKQFYTCTANIELFPDITKHKCMWEHKCLKQMKQMRSLLQVNLWWASGCPNPTACYMQTGTQLRSSISVNMMPNNDRNPSLFSFLYMHNVTLFNGTQLCENSSLAVQSLCLRWFAIQKKVVLKGKEIK